MARPAPRTVVDRIGPQEALLGPPSLAQHGGAGAFSLELDHSTGTGRMVIALMRDALAISSMPIPSKLVGEAQS